MVTWCDRWSRDTVYWAITRSVRMLLIPGCRTKPACYTTQWGGGGKPYWVVTSDCLPLVIPQRWKSHKQRWHLIGAHLSGVKMDMRGGLTAFCILFRFFLLSKPQMFHWWWTPQPAASFPRISISLPQWWAPLGVSVVSFCLVWVGDHWLPLYKACPPPPAETPTLL